MAFQFMLKKKKANPEAFIYLRYSYKENDCLIATGKKILIKQWNETKQRPNQSYTGGSTTLTRFLGNLQGEVTKAVTEIENEGDEPLPEEVKKRYTENKQGITRGATKAITLWNEFIQLGEGKKEPVTILNETDSMNTFIEFLKSVNKEAISLRRINPELIAAYEKHLSKFADNTRAKRLKHFKAFLKHNKHQNTQDIKFKEMPGDKIFLTEAELTAIELKNLDSNPLLKATRDLFCLQCETGLRVSDLFRLGPEHIQGSDLLLRAKKNDSFIRMPISKKINEILTAYNHKLPVMDKQAYNENIRSLAAVAIPTSKVEVSESRAGKKTITTYFKSEVLTSHCAVRTFITLASGRGMPVNSIASLTGKNVQTLLRSYLNENQAQAYQDAIKYAR